MAGSANSAARRLLGSERLALLRRGLFGRRNDFDHFDRTAGLLDRFTRRSRNAGNLDAELGRQSALAENADAVLAATADAGRLERSVIDRAVGLERTGIDQLLQL